MRIKRQDWNWNKSIAVFCVLVLSVIFALYVYLLSCAAGNWAGRPYETGTAFSRLISGLVSRLPLRDDVISGLPTAGLREYLLFGISFSLLFFGGSCYVLKQSRLFTGIYRGRWILTALLVILVVAFDLNGTSLYYWKAFLGLPNESAPLWGVPRWVRWDEYHVWTPMALSQAMAGFPAFNPYMTGGNVDATWVSMGGLPAWNTALVFKPLYWGYFLLGASRGTGFLWIARSALLFWISYACAMHYTGKSRSLSFLAGVLFTFAPYVQWWYSQSIAEVFIFGQGILLCVYEYVLTDSPKKRWFFSALQAYCFGCLIMIGYPAWFIPVLYFAVVVIAVILISSRDRLGGRDLARLLVPLAAAVIWLLVIVWFSKDALLAVRDSSYPGNRLYTGGWGVGGRYLTGLYSLLFPLMDPSKGDPSTESCFLSFFPAGIIISCYSMLKEKKTDRLSVVLICCEVLIFCFLIIGVSKTFAKLTLLSQCTHMEALLGTSDIALLLHALSRGRRMPSSLAVPVAVICSVISSLLTYRAYQLSLIILLLLLAGNLFLFLLLLTFRADSALSRRFLTFSVTVILLLGGAFVNPIQRGTGFITDSGFIQELRAIPDDQGLYLMESDRCVGEVLILAQKRSFNSMQVYADPEKWRPVDPDGEYYDIYNQLCNIRVSLTGDPTSFDSLGKADIRVNLNFGDLKKLDIDYVLSCVDYRTGDRSAYFEYLYTVGDWHIYKVL